ncbi:MAG: hypothetical protein JWM35_1468 [Verrucomicrobia bacterium]|nr:hypothetical protein [Verrucomicrobiota bacterium]
MSSGPTGAARLDLPALLSSATLKLAPDLRTTRTRGNLLAVHNPADRRYLVIPQSQWEFLELFSEGATVSSVLCEIISENHCPPLREFYELVVKAYQHSVLLVEGRPPPNFTRPSSWRFALPPEGARMASLILLGVSGTVVLLSTVQMPTHGIQIVIGVLLAVLAGSIGQFLAACTLRGAGCYVYRPHFAWLTLAPRFRVAIDEAIMGGRETEINVALVRLIPPFVFAAAVALKAPQYYLPLLAGVFVQLSPLWHTPMLDLLRAMFRDPRQSTRTRFIFASSRPFALLAEARHQFTDRKFILAGTIATIIWLALVFITVCVLFQANAVDLLHRFYLAGGLRYTGLAVVIALGSIILGIVGLILWIVVSHVLAWARERQLRRRRMQVTGSSPEAVAELLANIVLFRDLPPDALRAVAAAMKSVEFPRGEFVIRSGEVADKLYVVVAGRLEVIRHYDDGKTGVVAEMFPGDILGEIAVVQGGTRTRSIRCAVRSIVLALSKADFERLVLTHVTRAAVVDAVQKVGFLQNIELVKNWPQQSLAAFARLAYIHEYSEGDIVVREGTDNLYLYLVHRGEFAISQNGKLVRKIRQGESYGELGILQNSTTTTSVVATMPGSCLVISKASFLKFITQDFTISLQFEELGSKRLGKKFFKKGPGFDVMRA